MENLVVSKAIFEMLIKHLVNIEEEKNQVIEKYYPNPTKEKEDFWNLIDGYMKGLEGYISRAKVKEEVNNNCPFVIIGSIVEIQDMESEEIDKLQVISPFLNDIDMKLDSASYLSPMGQALLLKKPQEEVIVETPMGKFSYQIKSIEFPGI